MVNVLESILSRVCCAAIMSATACVVSLAKAILTIPKVGEEVCEEIL